MDTDLRLFYSKIDNITVINLSGDVDAFTCQKLRDAIKNLIQEGENKVVIGISNIRYIDSSGLGTLIGGLRRVTEKEGGLAIAGANAQVEKVLKITGLNKVFQVYPNEADAVVSLKN